MPPKDQVKDLYLFDLLEQCRVLCYALPNDKEKAALLACIEELLYMVQVH